MTQKYAVVPVERIDPKSNFEIDNFAYATGRRFKVSGNYFRNQGDYGTITRGQIEEMVNEYNIYAESGCDDDACMIAALNAIGLSVEE